MVPNQKLQDFLFRITNRLRRNENEIRRLSSQLLTRLEDGKPLGKAHPDVLALREYLNRREQEDVKAWNAILQGTGEEMPEEQASQAINPATYCSRHQERDPNCQLCRVSPRPQEHSFEPQALRCECGKTWREKAECALSPEYVPAETNICPRCKLRTDRKPICAGCEDELRD